MNLRWVKGAEAQLRRLLNDSLGLSRSTKRIIVILVDCGLALTAVWLAFWLRLGYWDYITGGQWLAAVAALMAIPIFWIFGIYRALFRHVGLQSLVGIARAILLYTLLYGSIFLLLGVSGVPRTVGLIQPLIYFVLVGIARIGLGALVGRIGGAAGRSRVLIYGAGASGRQLASAISGSGEMDLLGFIDDDPHLARSVINGKHIFSPGRLERLVQSKDITDILLALPSTTRARRAQILEGLQPLGVNVRTVPGLMDLANGRVEVSALRSLEIEDLLGRDPVQPDGELFHQKIRDKVVLVTGSGGSIGSELCRQILKARPARLLLLEQNEFALYAIERELRDAASQDPIPITPLLGSVRDGARGQAILKAWSPATVFHAAAYKHVPLVEENIAEGVWNNAFGTYTMALAAQESGVEDFVLISTDKAVRPTNVMGATKRLAELCLQALAEGHSRTRFSMVRFGNVLGSSGSVVPLFRSQIANGGPVTITHPDVTRYFMTIPEAAQLVIQAASMAEGGEVFLLDMGAPVRIADLARKMIELSGATVKDESNPDGDIEITVVGLRPGEKLYEELLIGNAPVATRHPLIMKSRESHLPRKKLESLMLNFEHALRASDIERVHGLLRQAVPEFQSASISDLLHGAMSIDDTSPSSDVVRARPFKIR